jgi:hypothetical protein
MYFSRLRAPIRFVFDRSIRIFTSLATLVLRRYQVFVVYRFGNAIGDQLCMTAIVFALHKAGYKVVVLASYPELFVHNPFVWKNIDLSLFGGFSRRVVREFLEFASEHSPYVEYFGYRKDRDLNTDRLALQQGGLEAYLRETKSKESLIQVHSRHFNTPLNLSSARPMLFFDAIESNNYETQFACLHHFALISPLGKTTYTPNKEWGFENYQEVVNLTRDKVHWLQVGFTEDRLLENVVDFRGKTDDLRALSYLVKKADFVLANEGLLNHLAAAVETRCITVFTGFSQVELALYDTTIAISVDEKPACSPCWKLSDCDYIVKPCTVTITPACVVEAIDAISEQYYPFSN